MNERVTVTLPVELVRESTATSAIGASSFCAWSKAS